MTSPVQDARAMTRMHALIQAMTEAMREYASLLDRLQQRLDIWETTILPEILERLPNGIPHSDNEENEREPQQQGVERERERAEPTSTGDSCPIATL